METSKTSWSPGINSPRKYSPACGWTCVAFSQRSSCKRIGRNGWQKTGESPSLKSLNGTRRDYTRRVWDGSPMESKRELYSCLCQPESTTPMALVASRAANPLHGTRSRGTPGRAECDERYTEMAYKDHPLFRRHSDYWRRHGGDFGRWRMECRRTPCGL